MTNTNEETTDLNDINHGFDIYQDWAKRTAIYPESAKLTYPMFGISAEVGELHEHYKKVMRDGIELDVDYLVKELGDVLWYVSAIAHDLGISLGYVAERNIQKLQDRQKRGVLGGSGNDR